MTDLDAIRDRVTLYSDPEWRGEQDRWVHAACEDATALLTEVDRLTAHAAARDVIGDADAAWDGGVLNERSRIRRGVQMLAGFHLDYTHMNETKVVALDVVHRSQVMSVIDERDVTEPLPPLTEPVKVTRSRHDA